MTFEFPAAVPEIPVSDIAAAAAYYQDNFGFSWTGADTRSASQESRKVTVGCSSRARSIGKKTATSDPC